MTAIAECCRLAKLFKKSFGILVNRQLLFKQFCFRLVIITAVDLALAIYDCLAH
jgi:hypothetical protein